MTQIHSNIDICVLFPQNYILELIKLKLSTTYIYIGRQTLSSLHVVSKMTKPKIINKLKVKHIV